MQVMCPQLSIMGSEFPLYPNDILQILIHLDTNEILKSRGQSPVAQHFITNTNKVLGIWPVLDECCWVSE